MKKCINVLAFTLVVVGALNWGLWGLFQFDVVAWLFGGNTVWLSRVAYSIVGLAGLWALGNCTGCCKTRCCSEKKSCCSKDSDSCEKEEQ